MKHIDPIFIPMVTLTQFECISMVVRYVKCRNPGCTVELLQAWEQPRHESELCPLRPVDCPLGCGGRMSRSGTFAHVDAACPLRTVTCSLNCGASVRARDVEIHLQDDCPHRVVRLRLLDFLRLSDFHGIGHWVFSFPQKIPLLSYYGELSLPYLYPFFHLHISFSASCLVLIHLLSFIYHSSCSSRWTALLCATVMCARAI